MANRVKHIRHTTPELASFTGVVAEVTVNTSEKSVVVHDGITPGGYEQARADLENVAVATASNNGKMSAQQAADLTQTLLDVAANLAAIQSNDTDIATLQTTDTSLQSQITSNDGEIATLQSTQATKANKHVPAVAGNVALLDVDGHPYDATENIAALLSRTNHTDTQSYTTITGLGTLANANSVNQGTIDAASIGQAELKSTTGIVSTASTIAHLTLAGGEYGFYPRVRESVAAATVRTFSIVANSYSSSGTLTIVPNHAINTAYVTRISLGNGGGGDTVYAQQRYIQASPPYNLGDGDIPLFIFAVVDSLGKIESLYVAAEGPWHYNGPTDICATRKDTISGRSWRKCCRIQYEKMINNIDTKTILSIPALADDVLNDKNEYEIEITQDIKQADMTLIPHAFTGNDLTEKTVILLDPVSSMTEQLLRLHDAGEDVSELLYEGYITFGNSQLARATPDQCMCVDLNWKNTKK